MESSGVTRLRSASIIAYRSILDLTERERKHLLMLPALAWWLDRRRRSRQRPPELRAPD